MTLTIECFGNIYERPFQFVDDFVDTVKHSEIQLRDYQQEAYEACIRDLRNCRSSLIVLATGLGKTILFSKIIESWKGRVLVLVHLEELLQNAYQEIESITGEIIGIERQKDRENGERVVVSLIHTLKHTYQRFPPNFFSLIIIDEAHHSASDIYKRILEYFGNAKVIGLTATDSRADGKKLPFDTCSYRMGIREGISSGYLVPIRGRRVIIDSINLTKVKQTGSGDFDDAALDDEMVKGASAIADVITSDYPFDKGILFFPGCASAKLTSQLINKRLPDSSVYIDGKITGNERRLLVGSLRSGVANWLCNVGIATEGFNWPEAAVIGMCAPTLSRAAYVQRAGRGTRPLAGILNQCGDISERCYKIAGSTKPYMTILDFVGISANLNLISAESFLEPIDNEPKEKPERVKTDDERQEDDSEGTEDLGEDQVRINLGISRIASNVQSRTVYNCEPFDPFEKTGEENSSLNLKTKKDFNSVLSEKQYKLLLKYGIDDISLSSSEAQKLIGFIAQNRFRLTMSDKSILNKLYGQLKDSRVLETS